MSKRFGQFLKLPKKMGHGILGTFRQFRYAERNILIFVVYGLLFDVFMNLHRPFNVKFLTRVGGGEFHIALLNSLPGIVAVFAIIPGSLLINRFASKRGIISGFFIAARLFVLALVFVPILPLHMQPLMFVLLFSFMNFPDAISQTGLQSYLGEVFDGVSRSRAITLRNKFGQIVAPVIAIITGLIITLLPRGTAEEQNAQAILIYQIFFGLAFVIACAEIFVFRKLRERKTSDDVQVISSVAAVQKTSTKESLRAIPGVLKDKRFVGYMIPTLFFFFMFQSGWPLFGILQVIVLEATELHMATNAALAGLSGFIGAGVWTRIMRRKGNDFTCFLCAMGLAVGMIMTAFAPTIEVYIVMQIVAGFSGVGVVITLLNGLLTFTPDKNRVIYISVYNTFVSISLAISPFFAHALQNRFGVREAMFIVGVGRIFAAFALLAIYFKTREKKTVRRNVPKRFKRL
ncbi:MAG: MFS transporter [Defluviitaleaceae bacterium]|nr:MFS transporter [Defluviitaleaceae bacterium]